MGHNSYKFEFVLVFIVTFFIFIPMFLLYPVDLDQTWNYQFARRIICGQVPYRDFNIIVTPLSAQLNALLITIFPDEMIVLRWEGALIAALNACIIYIILRKYLNIKLVISLFILTLFVMVVNVWPQNNYSWTSVLFLSLAMLFEYKYSDNIHDSSANIYVFIIGIILGIVTIIKHNIGIAGLLCSLVLSIVNFRLYSVNRSISVSQLLQQIWLKLAGWFVIVVIELLYLWQHNALSAFIDFTISGMGSYTNRSYLPYSHLVKDFYNNINAFSVLIPIALLSLLLKFSNFCERVKKGPYALIFFYSIANFSLIYPISDTTHLALAAPLSLIATAVILNELKIKHDISKGIYVSLAGMVVISVCISIYKSSEGHFVRGQELRHYKYLPISQEKIKLIKGIDDFIVDTESKGKHVYMLDPRASYFMIPIDKFNHKYDPMNAGNFGTKGIQEVLNSLSSEKNLVVLVRGEKLSPNWLEQKEFIDYAKN